MNAKRKIKLPLNIALILLLIMLLCVTVGFNFIKKQSIKPLLNIPNQYLSEINNVNTILSGGNVVKSGRWIYYKNFSENGMLYKMKEDGKNKTRLTNNIASYINIIDDFIYYVSCNGIYKVRTDGTGNMKIRDFKDDNKYKTNTKFKDVSIYKNEFYNLYAIGKRLYFIDSTRAPIDDGYKILISIDTDGKNERLHETGTNVEGFITYKGFIYYWGSFHVGGLYKMKLDDTNKVALTKSFITNVSLLKNQFYFLTYDFDNPEVSQRVFRTTDEFRTEKLLQISSKITNMSVTYGNIYYSTLDNPKTLYKADLEGNNVSEVCTFENEISNINYDGQCLYVVSNSNDAQGTTKSLMYKLKPSGQEMKLVN